VPSQEGPVLPESGGRYPGALGSTLWQRVRNLADLKPTHL
jgi:hypothetical protein